MPKYEYDCPRCGLFSDFRPMAEYEQPAACPACGAEAPRAALSFPAISTAVGTAMARQSFATSGHGAGCGCCGKQLKIPRKEWVRKLL
jgi:putative FmdB family regulatory protein